MNGDRLALSGVKALADTALVITSQERIASIRISRISVQPTKPNSTCADVPVMTFPLRYSGL